MEHVVITGADRGIGLALTENYLRNGYAVYAGRFMPEWPQLDELQRQYPHTLTLIPLNVGDDQSVREAARLVASRTDRVDYLINCAGIFPKTEDADGFSSAFQVNSLGPLRMVESFLPLMQQGRRRLCTFSSETGVIPLMQRVKDFPYCVSKAALNMEMHMLFQKLRPEGFTFRVFCPCGDGTGLQAGQYMQMDFCYDAREKYIHSEENRIVMRDGLLREISW